jgi:hypothetical protein
MVNKSRANWQQAHCCSIDYRSLWRELIEPSQQAKFYQRGCYMRSLYVVVPPNLNYYDMNGALDDEREPGW